MSPPIDGYDSPKLAVGRVGRGSDDSREGRGLVGSYELDMDVTCDRRKGGEPRDFERWMGSERNLPLSWMEHCGENDKRWFDAEVCGLQRLKARHDIGTWQERTNLQSLASFFGLFEDVTWDDEIVGKSPGVPVQSPCLERFWEDMIQSGQIHKFYDSTWCQVSAIP